MQARSRAVVGFGRSGRLDGGERQQGEDHSSLQQGRDGGDQEGDILVAGQAVVALLDRIDLHVG